MEIILGIVFFVFVCSLFGKSNHNNDSKHQNINSSNAPSKQKIQKEQTQLKHNLPVKQNQTIEVSSNKIKPIQNNDSITQNDELYRTKELSLRNEYLTKELKLHEECKKEIETYIQFITNHPDTYSYIINEVEPEIYEKLQNNNKNCDTSNIKYKRHSTIECLIIARQLLSEAVSPNSIVYIKDNHVIYDGIIQNRFKLDNGNMILVREFAMYLNSNRE